MLSWVYESAGMVLGLGFLLGLKHAAEADHVVAVSAIVSEQRSLWPSAAVGALWGAGHTASLLMAGFCVMTLEAAIPSPVAALLELAVALTIVFLGGRILYVILRGRRRVHVHRHSHGMARHSHLHFHGRADSHAVDCASGRQGAHHGPGGVGWRPVLLGALHGLAGSAALTLLVLTEVLRGGSATLGFFYLLVFGLGSVAGMLLMSLLIGLPFALAATVHARVLVSVRLLAGVASILFGIFYGVETMGAL